MYTIDKENNTYRIRDDPFDTPENAVFTESENEEKSYKFNGYPTGNIRHCQMTYFLHRIQFFTDLR